MCVQFISRSVSVNPRLTSFCYCIARLRPWISSLLINSQTHSWASLIQPAHTACLHLFRPGHWMPQPPALCVPFSIFLFTSLVRSAQHSLCVGCGNEPRPPHSVADDSHVQNETNRWRGPSKQLKNDSKTHSNRRDAAALASGSLFSSQKYVLQYRKHKICMRLCRLDLRSLVPVRLINEIHGAITIHSLLFYIFKWSFEGHYARSQVKTTLAISEFKSATALIHRI